MTNPFHHSICASVIARAGIAAIAALVLSLLTASPALAEVAVVVGPKTSNSPLTKEQTSAIFLGKSTSLPSGTGVVLFDLPESNPLRDEFYTKVTGKTAAQVKAHWAKMSFTGKGTPPREVASSSELKKSIAGIAGGIGYIEKAALDDSVRSVFATN